MQRMVAYQSRVWTSFDSFTSSKINKSYVKIQPACSGQAMGCFDFDFDFDFGIGIGIIVIIVGQPKPRSFCIRPSDIYFEVFDAG